MSPIDRHGHGPLVRLDRWVADRHGLSNSAARRLVLAGSVAVNGRRERRPARDVSATDSISVDRRALHAASNRLPVAPALDLSHVLFEDEWLVAFDKPAGLPTHATMDPDRPHLHGAAGALLAERDGKEPYLGIHHRLDRDTSGVVLFSKDRSVNAAIADAFASRSVGKVYVAHVASAAGATPRAGPNRTAADVARSVPPAQWSVRDHLGPVGRVGKTTRYGAVRSGGDAAHTDFSLLSELGPRRFRVEARPRTGRTHQIRVHLAGCALPIVGDRLYGGPAGPRVLLHASQLRLDHPITGATLHISSPLPPDMLSPGS